MKSHAKKSLFTVAGLALAASLLAPQAALAQQSGLYVGAGVGQSKARDACDGLGFGVSCDDKDTAWKLFVGYQFHPNFAVEGAYVDFGNASASNGFVSADLKAKTWQLVAVGTLPPQHNFSVFGKAGVHRWDADVDVTGFGRVASDSGTAFTFGFGGGYELTKNVGLRLEWERFKHVGESNTTGKSDVDVASLGVRYRF